MFQLRGDLYRIQEPSEPRERTSVSGNFEKYQYSEVAGYGLGSGGKERKIKKSGISHNK